MNVRMLLARPLAASLLLALCSLLTPRSARAEDCLSNLYIVLDRSCSMTSNSIMGKTRWAIAVDALNKLMTKNAGKLRFGLVMFPDKGVKNNGACAQTAMPLSPAANQEQSVKTQLTSNTPGAPCVTNIDEGIKQAAADPSIYATDRRTFILLITDGEQSNGCNGGTATADPKTISYIKDLYNKKVPTYVVGFDVGSDAQAQMSLNSFAAEGGLPNTGTNKFYPANNQAELEATLDKLAGLTQAGDVGLCLGMPCPDNRCLSATATCMNGFCVDNKTEGGGGDGGTDDGSGTLSTGCSCQVGGRSPAPALGLFALFFTAAFSLLRRRRSA